MVVVQRRLWRDGHGEHGGKEVDEHQSDQDRGGRAVDVVWVQVVSREGSFEQVKRRHGGGSDAQVGEEQGQIPARAGGAERQRHRVEHEREQQQRGSVVAQGSTAALARGEVGGGVIVLPVKSFRGSERGPLQDGHTV